MWLLSSKSILRRNDFAEVNISSSERIARLKAERPAPSKKRSDPALTNDTKEDNESALPILTNPVKEFRAMHPKPPHAAGQR